MKRALRVYGFLRQPLWAGIILLLIFTLLRLLFWAYNRAFFMDLREGEVFNILLQGLKQDYVSLLLMNGLPLLLLFAGNWFAAGKTLLLAAGRWIFILSNAAGIALNVLDIGYFSYALHRTNVDLVYVLGDSLASAGSLIRVYWFLLLVFAMLIYVLVRISSKLFIPPASFQGGPGEIWVSQALVILVLGLSVKRPGSSYILPSSPLLAINAKQLPLAQNSLFTFVYSLLRKQNQIRVHPYFSQAVLDSLSPSVVRLEAGGKMEKKNVVLFILESFSRAYLTQGDPLKARTPFLDSLIRDGIFFPHAFANGFNSNQGIVSILGGLPAFLDEPFYYSSYANMPLHGIGNILVQNGYRTIFFMGAKRDHFGFEKFGRMAGIEEFHWREDFNDEKFYDGNWGIFDEPFFQYGAKVLSGEKSPFFAVFFNISSHPPFTIPPDHRTDFNDPPQRPAQRAISYTDYSLRKFFDSVSRLSWYRNTIFVFCADHYLYPGDGSPQDGLIVSGIPIFLFSPGTHWARKDSTVISQVDLGPSILHLLHFSGAVAGFGRDVFDTAAGAHVAINKPGPLYQIISGDYLLGFDPDHDRVASLYKYSGSRSLGRNLAGDSVAAGIRQDLETILKANIQRYQQALVRRSLE